jgi:hypothetical protein
LKLLALDPVRAYFYITVKVWSEAVSQGETACTCLSVTYGLFLLKLSTNIVSLETYICAICAVNVIGSSSIAAVSAGVVYCKKESNFEHDENANNFE